MKKKSAQVQQPKAGQYFVSVKDHLAIRRTILETLRDILETLQKFHDFHQKRQEKAHRVIHLKALLNRTNKLIGRLKANMPDVKVPHHSKRMFMEEPTMQVPTQTSVQKSAPAQQPTPRRSNELDALENELAQIESKLSKLT